MASMAFSAFVAISVLLMIRRESVSAQPSQDCVNNLVPCANFLNSTNWFQLVPPESCCKPLKQAVETQRDCLCNLYNNPVLFRSLKINLTQAVELPKHCGISNDVSACKKGSTTPSTPSSPTTRAPPAGRDTGSAGKQMAWTGLSGMLLVSVSLFNY